MMHLPLPLLLLISIISSAVGTSARAEKGHALRHAETSVVVLSESAVADSAVPAEAVADSVVAAVDHPVVAPSVPQPAVSAVQVQAGQGFTQQQQLVYSMGSLLQSEAEVMDPKSPKAKLQRKLVALIWLERVLQQNLNNMNEETYRAKIAKSKAGLEQDTTPATADMLSRMRTEMHEFSVPFFEKAVKDELKDIRARQRVLLDKIIALDAGKASDDDSGSEAPSDGESKVAKKETKKPKEKAKGPTAEEKAKERAQKKAQSNMFIFLMVAISGTLILLLVGIAIKVHTHQSSSRT